MYTEQILDRAKEKLNFSSDYQLRIYLGITSRSQMSNYRSGKNKPDEEICFKLAEILEVEPQAIIAAVRLDAEKEPSKIEFWKRQAQKYALGAGIVAALASPVSNASFEGLNHYQANSGLTTNYALCEPISQKSQCPSNMGTKS